MYFNYFEKLDQMKLKRITVIMSGSIGGAISKYVKNSTELEVQNLQACKLKIVEYKLYVLAIACSQLHVSISLQYARAST